MPSNSQQKLEYQVNMNTQPQFLIDVALAYEDLPKDAQLLAKIFAIVYPKALTELEIRAITDQVKTGTNHFYRDSYIRELKKQLVAAGIAQRFEGGYLNQKTTVLPATFNLLTIAAFEDGTLSQILNAFLAGRRSYPSKKENELLYGIVLRCLVVCGQFGEIERRFDFGVPRNYWSFLNDPACEAIWHQLPEHYIDEALDGCLNATIDELAPPQPSIDLCGRFSNQPELHVSNIAFVRILQARFDEAFAVFDALPSDSQHTKPYRTGLASTKALIAMFEEDNKRAVQHIDEAIAFEKEGTRKKFTYPEHRAVGLSLIALLRENTHHAIQNLQQHIRTGKRTIGSTPEIKLAELALKTREQPPNYLIHPENPGYRFFLSTYPCAWMSEQFFLSYTDNRSIFNETVSLARENGYHWVHEECLTLNHVFDVEIPNSTQYVYVDTRFHRQLPDQPTKRHTHRSLTQIWRPTPPWELKLTALELVADETQKSNAQKNARNSDDAERRLAWVIDTSRRFSIRAVEQRRNKNKSWSKGRRIANRRLVKEQESVPSMHEQDRLAAGTIEYDHWTDSHYELTVDAVYSLRGHPNLFNEQGQSLEIVEQEPEISLRDLPGDSTSVTIDPQIWDYSDKFAIARLSDRKIAVFKYTDTLRSIYNILGTGVEFPPESKERAIDAVSALLSQVRVQSTAVLSTDIEQVETVGEPWVILQPIDDVLSAAFVVEPIPETELYYTPGVGFERVIATRDGQRVAGIRDLQAEESLAQKVIEACPLLSSKPTENDPLLIQTVEESLELLDLLQQNDIRCKWPKGEKLQLLASPSPQALAISATPVDQWLSFKGQLAIDEQRVFDLTQILELLEARPDSRFLELGKGEFLALSSRLRRHLDDLASIATPSKGKTLRVHALATSVLDEFLEDVDADAVPAFHEQREKVASALALEPEIPSTLQAELRPYQVDGFRWLSRMSRIGAGVCLADDMGLGKTVQTLAVILERAGDGPTFVVAPTSVVTNWRDEAHRFAPTLNVKVYTGPAAERVKMLEDLGPFDLVVTSYGLLIMDIDELSEINWQTAVFDESQSIKNPVTRRARAARRISAQFIVATTGTPIQNNLIDLYSLFSVLNPGLLGSQQKFRSTFAEPIERNNNEEVRARLRRVIAPFVLRRLKSDVLDDLPERTEITLRVPLSADESELYEALRRRAMEELENPEIATNGESNRFQIFKHLTRLRLACCNPRLVLDEGVAEIPSSKLAAFTELLDELIENRHKVLVFSQFVRHLKLVQEQLDTRKISYQYLDGSTSIQQREKRVTAFQKGEGDVFLISLKAGGTGLNLTAADYVIHLDPWWNPAVEDQASDRSHRIGQTRPVTIYRLITEGTIEERVVELHHKKRDLADRLLEGADAIARIDPDELFELISQPLNAD